MTKSKNIIAIIIVLIFGLSILVLLRNNNEDIVIGKMEQNEFSFRDSFDGPHCGYFFSRDEIINMQYLHNYILAGNYPGSFHENNYFAKLNNTLIEFKKVNDKWIGGKYELTVNETYRSEADPEHEDYGIAGNFIIKNLKNGKSITQDYVGFCAP